MINMRFKPSSFGWWLIMLNSKMKHPSSCISPTACLILYASTTRSLCDSLHRLCCVSLPHILFQLYSLLPTSLLCLANSCSTSDSLSLSFFFWCIYVSLRQIPSLHYNYLFMYLPPKLGLNSLRLGTMSHSALRHYFIWKCEQVP